MSLPLLGGMRKNTWPFSPQALPNCVMWLDAADTSTYNTASVAAWRNKGFTFGSTSGSGGFTSTNINGVPALSIAANATRTAPSVTYTQTTRTVFSVTSSIPTATTNIITSTTNTTDIQMYIISGLLHIGYNDFTLMRTATNIQPVLSTPAICCATTTNTSSPSGATQGIFINGTSYALDINATGSFGTTQTSSQSIGWGGNAQSFTLGEVLIFDGALTNTERQQVEGYLANKWGIAAQLPATHPYYSSLTAILRPPNNRTFQPVDIAGCQLWLDAADVTTLSFSDANITAWADKSGNGYNATSYIATVSNSTYNSYATYSTNPVGVQFLNKFTAYATSYPANPVSETVFVVGNNSSPSGNNNMIIGGGQGARSIGFGFNGAATQSLAYLNNEVTWLANTGYPSYAHETTAIMSGYTTNSGQNSNISINGGALTTFNTGSTFYPNTTTYLGADVSVAGAFGSGNNYHYIGYTMEAIFYNRVLSSSEILQVQSYLAHKWGIPSSLPASHPGRFLPSFSTQFTPKSLGPALWLDAADASTLTMPPSSNVITSWADKSGNGNNATAYGSPQLIANVLKGQSAIYLPNPTNVSPYSFFQGSVSITGTTQSTFAVIQNTSAVLPNNTNGRIVSLTTPNNYDFASASFSALYSYGNSPGFRTQRNYGGYTYSGNLSIDAYVAEVIYDGTNVRLYNGGNLADTAGSTGTFGVTAYGIGNYPANAYPGISETFNGYIGEVLVYTTALTQVQRQQVEGYLAWKWGTQGSLPSTHPYKKFQP